MEAISVSSSMAGQCAPPWSCQIELGRRCAHRSRNFLPCFEKLQMKCYVVPRLRCSAKRRSSAIRFRRLGFGAVESRPFNLETGRLRLVSVVRAQEEEKEQQEVDKVEDKSPGCIGCPSNVLRKIPRIEQTSSSLYHKLHRLTEQCAAQHSSYRANVQWSLSGVSKQSWISSVQRANMVSRIFMATFVWISLFFGISVANNEMSGGRPGRRGPRK